MEGSVMTIGLSDKLMLAVKQKNRFGERKQD